MLRALALACIVAAPACAPPDAAQTALTATARALVAVDQVVADGYAPAAASALSSSSTRAEYEAAMQGWNDLEAGLRAARGASKRTGCS